MLFKEYHVRFLFEMLASWLGVVPNVYQSADKYHNGRITKRGSKVAGWITQKRKIVETETFSVDEHISIISEIIAIVEKKEGESM